MADQPEIASVAPQPVLATPGNRDVMRKFALALVENAYSKLPKTTGCQRARNKDGCGSWCCKVNVPSMFHAEYAYIVENEFVKWPREELVEVMLASVRNYLSSGLVKGCPMHDPVTLKCRVHNSRPLACRLYGITHKDTWKKREKALKQEFAGHKDRKSLFRILNQCDLVRTVPEGHRHVNKKLESEVLMDTLNAERQYGVPEKTIQLMDAPGGSYRAMHDHVLLNSMGPEFMADLTRIRIEEPSPERIEEIVASVRKAITAPAETVDSPVDEPSAAI